MNAQDEAVRREHKCQQCPFECFGEKEFNSHLSSAHPGREEETKVFECMYCDYNSKFQFGLNNHIRKYHAHKTSFTNIRPEPVCRKNPVCENKKNEELEQKIEGLKNKELAKTPSM